MDNTPRQPLPLYVKAVAALMTLVVSGLGLLAFFSRYAPPRWTRFGYMAALEGSSAQTFGLALFFYGLIPLMFFARSAKQAGWIGAVVATLGTLILVMGLIVFRSSI